MSDFRVQSSAGSVGYPAERRLLLALDRERTASANLQNTLGTERSEHARRIETPGSDCNTEQAHVARLREQVVASKNSTAALKDAGDRGLWQFQPSRAHSSTPRSAKPPEGARSDHMSDELAWLRPGNGQRECQV
jgi:hypothetical protein